MPKFIMMRGPEPDFSKDAGLGFCTICAMIYKGFALQEIAQQVEDAPEDQYVYIDLPEPHRDTDGLAMAVAFGLYLPFGPPAVGGNGMMPLPVPLCWSHLMPINVSNSAVIPASAADGQAMGLGGNERLPGGAVDLSQRRRQG